MQYQLLIFSKLPQNKTIQGIILSPKELQSLICHFYGKLAWNMYREKGAYVLQRAVH